MSPVDDLKDNNSKLNLELGPINSKSKEAVANLTGIESPENEVEEEKLSLYPWAIGYGIVWLWSWLILFVDQLGITQNLFCGDDGGCSKVFESEFGSVLGIKLSIYGVVFYMLPLASLLIIEMFWSKMDQLKMDGSVEEIEKTDFNLAISWKVFFALVYMSVGAEAYLVYAQYVLGEFCLFCSVLAFLAFFVAGIVFYHEGKIGGFNSLFGFRRCWFSIVAFLGIHFFQHPNGAYFPEYSIAAKERLELIKLHNSTKSSIDKPYELSPIEIKRKTKIETLPVTLTPDELQLYKGREDIILLKRDPSSPKIEGQKPLAIVREEIRAQDLYSFSDYQKNRIVGSNDAKLKVVIYFNYACSHCRDFELKVIPKMQDMIDDKTIKIEYRVYHTGKLKFSSLTAMVSACAGLQGPQVWHKVHRSLFESFDDWMRDGKIVDHIIHDVDADKFLDAMASWSDLEGKIIAESKLASAEGVNGTPSIFIYKKGEETPSRTIDRSIHSAPIFKEILKRIIND